MGRTESGVERVRGYLWGRGGQRRGARGRSLNWIIRTRSFFPDLYNNI